MRLLFSWIGHTDLKASNGELDVKLGPIGQAVCFREFDGIYLLSNYEKGANDLYVKWLQTLSPATIHLSRQTLSSPTHFEEIYTAVTGLLDKTYDTNNQNTFHLSPGTPAMASIWVLLGKTKYQAELIESSRDHGVKTVSFPFELAVDYLPDRSLQSDIDLEALTQGLPTNSPEFSTIFHRCSQMKRLITKARHIAVYDIPVLIQGESGTGKELFARAIHSCSKRQKGPFIAVNCGAIPTELFESEFFGHKKGAFTGAVENRVGYLESAHEGTLFLDEIGELPLTSQVKLLRAIQERVVTPIGSNKSKTIDIRIIAATNRRLIEEIAQGNFREDLFHRLVVGFLNIPSLRERSGELNFLIDHFLEGINKELSSNPIWKYKKFSASARNLMNQHAWPGNIRELYNTILRAAIWSAHDTIGVEEVRESLLLDIQAKESSNGIMDHPIENGVDLPDIMSQVARHYLKKALDYAHNNKTKAAELTNLANYQTFTNWMKKYGVDD